MRVLIADKFEEPGQEALRSLGCTLTNKPSLTSDELPAVLARGDFDVLIVRSKKVTAAAILGSSGLKAILRAGAGVDNIDVQAATQRGIGVCNCPGMNAIAVAELAIGLLIACDRRIPDQTAAIKAGRWDKKEFTTKSRGLKGSTLLIAGFGAIGQAVAKRAAAFEMNIVAWDRVLTPSSARTMGVGFGGTDRAHLLAALASCHAVSLHLALTPETTHLCDAKFFEALPPGSIFINTSRGGVVDESALRKAAADKGLRVGLDVYENQPATPQADFVTATSVLSGSAFTHHCGASTDQAQQAVADEVVRMVKVYMESGHLENCVNERALPVVETARPRSTRNAG